MWGLCEGDTYAEAVLRSTRIHLPSSEWGNALSDLCTSRRRCGPLSTLVRCTCKKSTLWVLGCFGGVWWSPASTDWITGTRSSKIHMLSSEWCDVPSDLCTPREKRAEVRWGWPLPPPKPKIGRGEKPLVHCFVFTSCHVLPQKRRSRDAASWCVRKCCRAVGPVGANLGGTGGWYPFTS